MKSYIALSLATLTLAACGTWHTSDVNRAGGTATLAKTDPASITVTTGDLQKPYTKVGDIEVTVRKATAFDSDPTPEKANEALREEAATLGANAVINARYGEVNIGFWSWGTMDASGTAVAYK